VKLELAVQKKDSRSSTILHKYLAFAMVMAMLGNGCYKPMPNNAPPSPSGDRSNSAAAKQSSDANIVDMRDAFERKTPLTAEDLSAANAFIDGKIEMVRGDPHMNDKEKAAAIADLESRRPRLPTKTKP
jgi:hypothetical protein